ncbi:MAG: hypothetical protein J4F40_03160 [Alphaproteobacteria bacterium]|nr:hypothetical protein [Alphaproteobacteria bacterium]
MADETKRLQAARARIVEEYGIELDDAHLKGLVAETDRILEVAREMSPELSFDGEPADFPASLVRLRDSS